MTATAFLYLQAVVQGKMLEAFACGEQQVAHTLGVSEFVARHLSVLRRRRLQVLPDPDKVPPGLRQLGQEPRRHQPPWGSTAFAARLIIAFHYQHLS